MKDTEARDRRVGDSEGIADEKGVKLDVNGQVRAPDFSQDFVTADCLTAVKKPRT